MATNVVTLERSRTVLFSICQIDGKTTDLLHFLSTYYYSVVIPYKIFKIIYLDHNHFEIFESKSVPYQKDDRAHLVCNIHYCSRDVL